MSEGRLWEVVIHPDLRAEVMERGMGHRKALGDALRYVQNDGPGLGRPRVDTLNGSRFATMKELRFDHDGGTWRYAFAFDPIQRAIILVGGDKKGKGQKRFYKILIEIADERYADHLKRLEESR